MVALQRRSLRSRSFSHFQARVSSSSEGRISPEASKYLSDIITAGYGRRSDEAFQRFAPLRGPIWPLAGK